MSNPKQKCGSSTDQTKVSTAAVFLLFLIKVAFVPVCPEQQATNPRRGSTHLLTHRGERYVWTALDDEFIVYMAADEAVREGFHCISENIPADRLNDVLHKFGTLAIDSRPLTGIDALVGNRVRTELVCTHTGFYIHKPSAGRKVNEQHTAFVINPETV